NYEYDPATFLNQWHHIACLATETHLIVYIDGVNVGSDILDDAETFGSSGDNFTIGAGVMDGGTQHPFSGYIDDVRVYSRGLTPTEMENLGSGMEEPEAP